MKLNQKKRKDIPHGSDGERRLEEQKRKFLKPRRTAHKEIAFYDLDQKPKKNKNNQMQEQTFPHRMPQMNLTPIM